MPKRMAHRHSSMEDAIHGRDAERAEVAGRLNKTTNQKLMSVAAGSRGGMVAWFRFQS